MTDNEMDRMQQEAIKRAQEMHRRSNAFRQQLSGNDRPPARNEEHTRSAGKPTETQNSFEHGNESINETEKPEYHKPPDNLEIVNKSGGIFDTLFKDKEKTLILGIILLLMDEKTDNGLLMALMYLLI